MNSELYQKLFDKLDSLGVIRKTLELGCEFKINLPDEYWKILGKPEPQNNYHTWIDEDSEYSYVFALPSKGTGVKYLTGMDIKQSILTEIIGHPPVLSDCIEGVDEATKEWMYLRDTAEKVLYEIISKWNHSKPLLSDQSDELGEYLLTLLG